MLNYCPLTLIKSTFLDNFNYNLWMIDVAKAGICFTVTSTVTEAPTHTQQSYYRCLNRGGLKDAALFRLVRNHPKPLPRMGYAIIFQFVRGCHNSQRPSVNRLPVWQEVVRFWWKGQYFWCQFNSTNNEMRAPPLEIHECVWTTTKSDNILYLVEVSFQRGH